MLEAVDEILHRLPNGTAPYQVRILRKIKGIDLFTLGHDVSAQLLCSTPPSRVSDKDFVCERGYETIPLLG